MTNFLLPVLARVFVGVVCDIFKGAPRDIVIVGNGGNGAFSDFCLTPVRRAGLALLSI